MAKIRRAIISVSDKTGIVDFAKALSSMGVEIISTGGTFKVLKEAGVMYCSSAELGSSKLRTDCRRISSSLFLIAWLMGGPDISSVFPGRSLQC